VTYQRDVIIRILPKPHSISFEKNRRKKRKKKKRKEKKRKGEKRKGQSEAAVSYW